MAGFTFLGIDHVNITAPEELMDDVLKWYSDCLGLKRIEKPKGTHDAGGWFSAGDQEVHVSIDPHNPPHAAHVGLVVDDSARVVEALRDAGFHIEQATSIPGRHRFFTRDPAGNRIEVMSFDEQHGSSGRSAEQQDSGGS